MKTLLVIAGHPDFADTIRAALDAEHYRVVFRSSVDEAEPLLAHGLAQGCVVDVELSSVRDIWLLEKLRRHDPKCPLVLFADGARQAEWEEEAYLRGVSHVLSKPVKPRMLAALMERLFKAPAAAPAPVPVVVRPEFPVQPIERSPGLGAGSNMNVLRDFSTILTHSLDAEGMLREFLLLLREILGINRAVIFLRQPYGGCGNGSLGGENQRLHAACALGVSSGLLEHFELSFEAGLGRQLVRLGRILRRGSEEARLDAETQKEFELLGAQVAVPILDRETLLGVAVFDGRITGEELINSELELIFHLLEQLGLAVKNIWLHEQLAGNHEMMTDILRELSSACVVVSRDLVVLHANKAARRFFCHAEQRAEREVQFSDLPSTLGSRIYQVLKTGSAISSFKFEPPESPGTVYNINIVPFQKAQNGVLPESALLTAEDLTQSQQLRRLEIEAANLRLIRTMADRLTHEIGNAMVPLSTHQQLLADKWQDPEFRSSLDVALAEGVRRVTRLVNQMRFLARDGLFTQEAFPLTPLLEEAYEEACRYQALKAGQLKCDVLNTPIILNGDRAALKHALTEVMLNALQANPTEPQVGVHLHTEADMTGPHALEIEVLDNGGGFSAETLEKGPSPFFTTRSIGLGLGLTVSRKIIETHRGKLELVKPRDGQAGVVRISLPLDSQPVRVSA